MQTGTARYRAVLYFLASPIFLELILKKGKNTSPRQLGGRCGAKIN
jgi:hypothetical protein